MERYKRQRRRNPYRSARSASLLIVCVLSVVAIFAVAVAFSPLGDILKSTIAEPILAWTKELYTRSDSKTQEAMVQATPIITEQPTSTPIRTTVLTISAKPYYILQMGIYENESEAILVSAQNQSMGGAGYVFTRDHMYRLFAAAYTDADSLTQVQKQIRQDGFVNDAYITDARSVRITLEGREEAIAIFEDAIAVMEEIPAELCSMTLSFDKQELSKEEVQSKLDAMQNKLEGTLDSLNKIASDDTEPLQAILQEYKNELSTFLLSHDSIKKDLYAGMLKHLQISCIDAYLEFFERNNNG